MKKSKAIYIIILCLLILIASLGYKGATASDSTLRLSLQSQVISGDGYSIVPMEWQVEGCTTGSSYSLQNLQSNGIFGSGCCCIYLPSVIKKP